MTQRPSAQAYLVILGSLQGLAWVLAKSRMAFTQASASPAAQLRPDDLLFLYTTRGLYGNPTRDRGRVIAEATVISGVRRQGRAVKILDREFTHVASIRIDALAPLREGVELAPLVSRLRAFPSARAWSARMRRSLLPLPPPDAKLIGEKLSKIVVRPSDVIGDYLDFASTRGSARR